MKQLLQEAEAIQENYQLPKSPYDGKSTKTAQFMLPAIGINSNNELFLQFFENAFLADGEHQHNYTRPIFLLFSIDDYKNINWKKVYGILTQSKNFITEYDVGVKDNKFLLMIVFSVPIEYEKDYYNFRLGRYSLFSDNYKKKFLEFENKKSTKKNILWQIIHKDVSLRDQLTKAFNVSDEVLKDEIWEKPRLPREYYRYKKIN